MTNKRFYVLSVLKPHTYVLKPHTYIRVCFCTMNECIQILLLTFGKNVILNCLGLNNFHVRTGLQATPKCFSESRFEFLTPRCRVALGLVPRCDPVTLPFLLAAHLMLVWNWKSNRQSWLHSQPTQVSPFIVGITWCPVF